MLPAEYGGIFLLNNKSWTSKEKLKQTGLWCWAFWAFQHTWLILTTTD